jgi:hypothetical protein
MPMLDDPEREALWSRKDWLFLIIFLVIFLSVFGDFFFTSRVFYERDVSIVEVPARKLTATLLKQGNFALWTDSYGNGQPFLANPKNAVLYPTTWLYLVLPLFTAFKLHYFFHVVVGWLGLYLLLKSYSLTRKAAFLGASVFAFSGMYVSSFEFYNHIAALAWAPAILLLLNRERLAPHLKLVLLSSSWALMILAGAPEIILITLVLCVGQLFIKSGVWKRRTAALATSLGFACLLSAIQLFPSLELLQHTERQSQSVQWPLELVQLVNLPFPNVLGNDRQPGHSDFWGWHMFDNKFPLYYSLYMGVGVLLLCVLALKRPLDRKRMVFLLLFSVFFLLSCGRYSPFFFIYRSTPFLASIRYPVKFFLGSVFCLSVLAGMGFDKLTTGTRLETRTVRTLLVSSVALATVYLVFEPPIISTLNKLLIIDKPASLREFGHAFEKGFLVLALSSMIVFFLAKRTSAAPYLVWGFMALAVLDPAYHNRIVNPTIQASFYERPPLFEDLRRPLVLYRDAAYAPFFKETTGDNLRLLSYFRQTLYPFTGIGDGVRYVFNWDFYGTYSKSYISLIRAIKSRPAAVQLKILDYLGCAAYVGDGPMFSKEKAQELNIEGFSISIERITENRARPYAVNRTATADTVEHRIDTFMSEMFDPLREAVLGKHLDLGAGDVGSPSPAIGLQKEFQGRAVYSSTSFNRALAIFPGNYAKGWRAWVDGRRADIFEANLLAKGVIIPPGEHVVELRYFPASFVWGAAVSLGTLLLTALALFGPWIWIKKRARPASA